MKFLLFKPGTQDGSEGQTASLGMGIVARSIKDAGHTVSVIDGELTIGAEIGDCRKYDIVALSVVSLEAKQADREMRLAQFKGKTVWIGGPHALGYYDLIDGYDKIIVGDADGCIEETLGSSERVVFTNPKQLLAPDYSEFVDAENMTAYSTYISRGCMNGCSFCASNMKLRGRFRIRDLDSIKNEFDEIKRYPKVESINMIDDSFSADLDHAKSFLDWYISNGFPYKINVFNVRADQIDAELLQLMKRAGQHHLPLGVESACQEVFDFIGKGEKLSDIENAIKMIHAAGIVPWLNMIVGLPKDNLANHAKSAEWAKKYSDIAIIHWFQYTPYRRTRAYDWLVKNGAIQDGHIAKISYGMRYQDIPWKPDFETADFSVEEREAAQLHGFLICNRKIDFDKMNRVEELCMKYDMMNLLEQWFVRRPAMAYFYKKDDDSMGALAALVVS